MLHEEIDNVRMYIKTLRQPSGRGSMVVVEKSADLIEMVLNSIAERVKALEHSAIKQAIPEEPGNNVIVISNFKNRKK